MSDATEHVDAATGTTTTGHEWDGIKELNTPLPRWWLWTFYATIVWAIGYSILYPAWPLVHSAASGFSGYSSRGALTTDLDKATAAQAQWLNQIKSATLADIVKNPELL